MAYATRVEVRALKPLDDAARYSDEMIDEGIEWATSRIDEVTGTSWEPKTHTITLNGSGSSRIWTGIPFVRSITSVTVNGDVVDTTDWVWSGDGYLIGSMFARGDSNVVAVITAGATLTAPPDIAWACRTLARWYVLRLASIIPDNTIQVIGEAGTVMVAQPGKYGPTSIPEVNAVLMSRCHKAPSIG